MSELESIRNIATIVQPFTSAIVDTWLKPRISAMFERHKTKKAIQEHAFVSKFEEYLTRAYDKHRYLNILVFQNQRRLLDELYVPLRLRGEGQLAISVDRYPAEFIQQFQRILITDTAGMGKSTMMKFLFLRAVEGNYGIPVMIELRRLSAETGVLDALVAELSSLDHEIDREFVLELVKDGHFIFFLDGYDEIPLAEREKVTENLQVFFSKASHNQFVLTSRPEAALATFVDFISFTVQPLEREEAYTLLGKYDGSNEVAHLLIAELEQASLPNVKEFLINPLLVSLLYKAYEYRPSVPFKKHVFYRQVYDALFETHDLTKPSAFVRKKHSGLDVEDFHRVLRALGYLTIKLGKVEYEKDEVVRKLEEASTLCPGVSFKSGNFLRDLLTTVPLFLQEGHSFRWSHKSIQEYFAAQFISVDAKDVQSEILRKMAHVKHGAFENVLDLCYDMDYPAFRTTLIYDLAKKFVAYCDNTLGKLEGVTEKRHVDARCTLTFERFFIIGPLPQLTLDDSIFGTRDLERYGVLIPTEQRSFIAIAGTQYDGGPTVFDFINPDYYHLIELLARKGNEIVVRNEMLGEPSSETRKMIQELLAESKALWLLTNEPSHPLNVVGVAPEINKLLAQEVRFILSQAACRTLVRDVENELAARGRDYRLLQGL